MPKLTGTIDDVYDDGFNKKRKKNDWSYLYVATNAIGNVVIDRPPLIDAKYIAFKKTNQQ